MPRPYPAEFRARAVALVRAGRPISRVAVELGISEGGLHNWVRQDRVDRGELSGITTAESAELSRAKRRIRELELEVEILRKASAFLTEDRPHPKGFTRRPADSSTPGCPPRSAVASWGSAARATTGTDAGRSPRPRCAASG